MARLMDFVRGRKGTVFSMLLHVLVLAWGLLSFAPRPLEAKPPQDFIPVDVISAEQLSQITKGSKTGKKENQGALVEKIAPPKPDQDPIGKVNEKKEIAATSDATVASREEGGAEARREEAGRGEARRRAVEEGSAKEAGRKAGDQGCAEEGREAEEGVSARLREDRGAARQAQS